MLPMAVSIRSSCSYTTGKSETYNILFAAICILESVSVLFSQSTVKNHVHLLHVPCPHNLIEIGHVLPVSLKTQFWRVSGSLKVLGSLQVPYKP